MGKTEYSPEIFLRQIEKIAERHGLKFPGGFEKEIGMRGGVSAWQPLDKKGFPRKYSIPSVDTLLRIKNLFDVSIDWLLTGQEPKTKEILQPIISSRRPELPPGIRSERFITVPQVEGRIAAKYARAIPPLEIKSLFCLPLSPAVGRSNYQSLLAIQVASNYHAMEPTIRTEDLVFIDPYDVTPSSRGIYAVRSLGGEGCDINRIYVDHSYLIISYDNPDYRRTPRILPLDQAERIIIGRVLWSWSSWRY